MKNLSRRQFLRSTLASGAGLLSTAALSSLAGCAANCVSRGAPPRQGLRVLADLHVHAMMNQWHARAPLAVQMPLLVKVAEKFFNTTKFDWESSHRAGIDLLCVTHFNVFDEWLSMPTDPNPEAPANTLLMMDLLEQTLNGPAAPFAKLARNHQELQTLLNVRAGNANFRTAVVHTLEGGHALGGSLEPLKEFARRGVALITITHFFNKGIASAPNAYPYFPDDNSRWPNQGLSEFGAAVIKEMEACGILVDVTHTTATALAEALRVSTKPLVATHSSARTLGDHPYSFYDEQIQEIARRGGIIGVILYPYALSNFSGAQAAHKDGSLRDVVRTVRYLTKICGTHKCLGIGSDFLGFISGPKEMTCLSEIDQLRKMLQQEFDGDEKVVEDIMANNVIAFLQNHWRSGI